MSRKSEQGNVLEIVIIAVLALAVIGLLVWRFVDSNNKKTEEATTSTQTEQSTETKDNTKQSVQEADLNEGYIVLEDWGVRFKPSGGTRFSYSKTKDGDYYRFSTSVLENLGKYCEASEGGKGTVFRSPTKDPSDSVVYGLPLNNGQAINGYYYFMQGPQSMGCGDYEPNQQQIDTELAQAALIKSLILTLEAKQ